MKTIRAALILFLLLGVTVGSVYLFTRHNATPGREVPIAAPTEHWQNEDAEQRNKLARHQWVEQMHRAAPDVDWREVERDNGLQRQQLRREAIARHGRDDDSRWTETGSRNLAGRMHAVALSANGDSLYGGSSRGGVWKGSLWGEGWRPLSDNLYGGAHGLAVAGGLGGDPEVVTSITDNGLVNYSEDGGVSWHWPSGIPASLNEARRVVRDPADPDRVYLMIRPSSATVLYRSDDAGRSYAPVLTLPTPAGDFWLDRISGGAVYVLAGNLLRVSHDQGGSWVDVGSIGVGSVSGVVLTASEAGSPTFYAAVRVSGVWSLYRSLDGGLNWEYRHAINDFWWTLCASIVERDIVLFGGVECWRSTNGGASFTRINGWAEYYGDPLNKLHADLPGLDCVWTGSDEIFYVATDGGLYRSDDGMATVTNISLEGLGVSQYYDTHTSSNDPDLILAGSQDQGYQRSDRANGELPRDFTQLISGDYGHLTSSNGAHDVVFSVYPGFVLVQEGEDNPTLPAWLDFPAGENHSWLPFILANPHDPQGYYFCATHLYHGHWTGGSSVLYTSAAQNFTEHGSNYLTGLTIAPSDNNRRLAVTDTGKLWFSHDGGVTWIYSGYEGPDAHYFYGTTIIHAHSDPLLAWVGGSGYSGPAVYKTTDGGLSWRPVGNGLPATLVYELALESPDNEVLYAATEAGPFRYDDDDGSWQYIGGTTAPLTTYWCVEGVPAANLVRFGTYGRGIWDYDVSTTTGVAENPAATEAPARPVRALAGYPNPFNPRTTVRFQLEHAGTVRLEIFDLAGRNVRVLHAGQLVAGEHEFVWDGLGHDGQACPSAVYLATVTVLGHSESLRLTLAR